MKDLMMPREDSWGFMRLQNCILNIAQYIHEFCSENGIDYCLMGGSALGAVRHQGFIPWDDDLDIFMTPYNYEKFQKLFKQKGDTDNYYLHEKKVNGYVSTAKLRLNHSTYIEGFEKDYDIHKGVFVDIFILHTCPDNVLKRKWQYIWSRYVITKGLADKGLQKKGVEGTVLKLLACLPKCFLSGFALKQLYRYRNENSEFLCHFMGHATMKNALYKREYFEKVKPVKFEETELMVPHRVEEYLRDRWGDYMKIPPMEEIKKCQHCQKWSDSETFKGFKPNGDYKDEWYLLP